jgi:hypothetical protein
MKRVVTMIEQNDTHDASIIFIWFLVTFDKKKPQKRFFFFTKKKQTNTIFARKLPPAFTNDTRADIDGIFPRQTASGCNAAVKPTRNGNGQPC